MSDQSPRLPAKGERLGGYFATREELTSGLTVIGSIVNGWRRVKGG